MAFRIVFSLVFLFFILLYKKMLISFLRNIFVSSNFFLILMASLLIGINQFGFIYSISVNQVLQSSFAYYIFPLIAITLAFIFLKERFSNFQTIAIFLAVIAIILLSLGIESFPFISIIMGGTFAIYGLIKKKIELDALYSVTLEILLLCPIALGFIIFISYQFPEKIGSLTNYNFLILFLSGLITALPLYLFSLAAQRLRYSTVSIINYLNPTLQFLVAIIIFLEPFNSLQFLSFFLIWVGLTLYSYDSIRPLSFRSKKISSTVSQTLK